MLTLMESPWISYHQTVTESLAKLIGTKENEVVAMITTNLHLLIVSFYRPNKKGYKTVIEKQAFPSDYYAILSQLKFHSFSKDDLIEVASKLSCFTIDTSYFLQVLEDNGDNIVLVLLSEHNTTGQVFDMPALIKKWHDIVGIDLAHAVGNISIELHNWEADFAVLVLVASKGFLHMENILIPKLRRIYGWWGNNPATCFEMKLIFEPINSVKVWQLSNPSILQPVSLRASLNIFNTVGIGPLRQKSICLTGYLNFLFTKCSTGNFSIFTSSNLEERECQLFIKFLNYSNHFFRYLQQGIACDYSHPEVIGVAPVSLCNSFFEVFKFYQIIDIGLYL